MPESPWINFEVFAAQLNTPFRLKLAEAPAVELRLVEANDHSTPRQEMFSLHFQGPREPFLPQATYPLEHDQLGPLAIFLVPIGGGENGFRYEAIYNRVRE